jgi:hypothetical protein
MTQHDDLDLPALEVLDAAGWSLPVGRLEALGLILIGSGQLRSANRIKVVPANGRRARSDDLVEALEEGLRRQHIRRVGHEHRLTPEGLRLLERRKALATDDAKRLARDFLELDDVGLVREADRLVHA